MPAAPRDELISRFEESVRDSGYQSLLLSDQKTKPFRFHVYNDIERFTIIAYIWTLTQGGGKGRHRDDEFKIQLTLSGNQWQKGLLFQENTVTLLLGWSEDLHVWAGFDAHYHQALTGRSNMVSIYGDALEKAANGQIGMNKKDNGETAVAFPPFFLVDYAKNVNVLHGYAQEEGATEAVEQATVKTDKPLKVADIPAVKRSTISVTLFQRYRDRRFRSNIIRIYGNRCAITGMQLDLVDAAHIIDVAYDESTDEAKNGLCLSALCHRAFDIGLIGVTPEYRIVLNQEKVAELQGRAAIDGLDTFRGLLRPDLILPKILLIIHHQNIYGVVLNFADGISHPFHKRGAGYATAGWDHHGVAVGLGDDAPCGGDAGKAGCAA